MKFRHISLIVVIGVFLVGCVSQQSTMSNNKPAEDFSVKFTVNPGTSKLNIIQGEMGCSYSKNGCIRVPTANSGEITFKFQANQPLPCADHPNSWILSKIELANIEGGFGNEVNLWIVSNFGAEESDGIVWEKGDSEEALSVTITDKNKHSGIVYYRITAKNCGTSQTADSDPRVINEGGTNIQ